MTSRRSTWKATERAVGAKLGGRRVPVSGRTRGDVPDVEHERLSIEVKHRASLPAWLLDAMAQADAARRGDRLAVVILHAKGRRHDDNLCVIRMRDLRALLDNA